jgi:hypothetical protein
MAISTNGTVLARLAGALYNTQMSNATYKEVASLDPSALADVLYARDFSASTDAAVATTLVTNLGLASVTGLDNWVAAQLTAAGSHKGAKVVELLNSFAQMTADTTYGAYATAFNTKVDAALALSQTTDNAGGTFAAAGTPVSATFALTAGTDTKTLGAGDDTIDATVATLGALDVVNGGAGNDTLNVVDSGAVASLGGATFSGIEKVNISAGGAVGAVAVVGTAAGTNTSAVAQIGTFTVASASTTAQKYNVTINGVVYESGTAAAATYLGASDAITAVISAHLGDSVSIGSLDATAHTTTITSAVAGTPLPTISVAISGTTGTGTASWAQSSTANVTKTSATAVKQIETITIASDTTVATTGIDAGDLITLSVSGVDYVVASSGDTETSAASDVAALINSVLGTGVASSSAGVVVVTAPVAGTPLPAMNLKIASAASVTDTWAQIAANSAANSAAVAAGAASAVTAPAGTTAYTVTATGDANITGVATSAIEVTGVNVRASGGSGTKVTASGSVYVSGSTGAVTITETAVSPTNGFYVVSDTTTTGLNGGWGSTTTYQKGTLVTGGTTVTITGKAGTAATDGTSVSTTDSTKTLVGSAANVGVTTANQATGKQTILNSALSPTGNVTINNSTNFTFVDTTNKLSLASVIYAAGDNKVYMNGGTAASVTGANSVTIVDLGTTALQADAATAAAVGTSKLTTATVNGLNGANAAASITSDALTNLTVVDARGSSSLGVTVTNNTAGHALNLTVGNSGTSSQALTVADAAATSVNLASQASAYAALGEGAINSGSTSYLTLNTPLATSITATNAQKVALGDLTASGYAKVGTINAASATGAITATVGAVPLQGLSISGGSGNDEITLKASTSQSTNSTSGANLTVNLGAGNDKLLNGNTTVHTIVGATFTGGDGNDLLAASLLNSGNAAQFTSFEVLGLDLTTDGSTFDASLLAGATSLQLLANPATSETVTYSGVATSQGLTVGANQSGAGSTILTFAGVTGTSDTYTIAFNAAGATAAAATPTTIAASEIRVNAIETLNIVSGSSSGYTNNTATLYGDDVRALVITGSQDANIGFASSHFGTTSTSAADLNGVNSIDASAMTGDLTISSANAGVSYAASVLGLSITTGSGADRITAAQKAVVNAGAGDDTITTASATSSTLTGGTGKDTFIVGATVYSTGPYTTTITDLSAGDKLTLKSKGTETFTSTKIDVSAATTLATAYGIAASDTNGSSNGAIKWFQYGGNTFVIEVCTANSTVVDLATGDLAVKLTGLVDLSTATLNDYTLTIV